MLKINEILISLEETKKLLKELDTDEITLREDDIIRMINSKLDEITYLVKQ
jgi:hypothetical protein